MMTKKETALFFCILVFAALVRLYNINGALFEFNPLRQALNASVARNFAYSTQADFFLPQADNIGPGPGYLMFELPVLPYLGSLLIRSFGIENWVFRLPSIVCFLLSCFFLLMIYRKILPQKTAMVALGFYTLFPMTIFMGRTFQVESLMMCSLLFSIYCLLRWIEEERIVDLILVTAGLILSVLLKVSNLYIVLFMSFLFLIYKKPRLLLQFIASACCVLAVSIWWWFIHSSPIRNALPTEYTFTDFNTVKVFGIAHIVSQIRQFTFSWHYWLKILRQCATSVCSPILFVLWLIGLFSLKRSSTALILYGWLASVLILLAGLPGAAIQDYYKIHLLPAAAGFAAIGFEGLTRLIKKSGARRCVQATLIFFICLSALMIVFPVIRNKPVFREEELLGKKIERLSDKEEAIIASFGPDPMLLFYCNRKGWSQSFLFEKNNIATLELRRRLGAAFFVCGNLDEFDADSRFKEYMLNTYRVIEQGPRLYACPREGTFEHALWVLSSRSSIAFFQKMKEGLERMSLGYVIFDIRRKL